jgi:signal transduction histidine kinase
MAKMNHELRTPLNGIIGLIDLLHDEVSNSELRENDDVNEYFDDIKYSSKHLMDLISETLSLSEIEKGVESLNLEKIALMDYLEELPKRVSGILNGNKFSIVNDSKITNFRGDKTRINQVFLNLLGNAFKFTQEGEVKLSVTDVATDGGILINFSISDNGIGVESDFLEKIFDPFSQEDSKDSRKYQGTGLGLTICKRIVELHNGDISVESKKSEGTTISFSIPIVGS